MENIQIKNRSQTPIKEFLENHEYHVNQVQDEVWVVTRDEVEVYLKKEDNILFFEVDLGKTGGLSSEAFYRDLLVLNTKILPVSLGVDSQEKEERLILLESREVSNLDDNEILSVFEAMEIAVHKVEALLQKHI